jgi:DNA-binding transcriptional LysR family regulator
MHNGGMNFDWNDLRYFLAVARAGSTLAASKRLKVSQATVSRRVSILEEALGALLFTRQPAGYSLTPRGQALLSAAETVEQAVMGFADQAAAETRRLTGTIKLTTVEAAANEWVLPAIAGFRLDHPDVQIEVITSDLYLDIARGEADIAIRFGEKPTQESLVVRHLIDLDVSFYATRRLVDRLGLPTSLADIDRYPLVIMSDDRTGFFSNWYAAHLQGAQVGHKANTLMGIYAGVRAGLGAAIMPCLMGDDDAELVRLLPPIPELTNPGWMVTTEQARQQPHVRALIDALVAYVRAELAARGTAA